MSVITEQRKENKNKKEISIRRSMFLLGGIAINNITNTSPGKIKSDRRKKRKTQDIKELYIKKLNDNEIEEIINKLINDYKTSYELCINALIFFPNFRNQEVVNLIKPYLKELIGLMDIISKEKNEELSDKALTQVAVNLHYKKILKNKFICKCGEKGNYFYIILKGKVVFLDPKIIKCFLNETEYFTYLLKLKKNKEYELLRNALILNRQFYDFGDDFDYFIREIIDDYKNNNKKHFSFITHDLYVSLLKIVEEEDRNKNDINNIKIDENKTEKNEIVLNLQEYIERSKVNDMNLNSKDRKKVNVFMYQITNYYEDGQIFGNVALESKFGKRTATAISLEDCDLGLLTKDQYNNTLSSIHAKSLENLFNTINSYNILGLAPKKAFDNRFCHMFKFIIYKRGAKIMEENQKINSVIVFNDGQFKLTVNKNILELNELVCKLHKIRGKMLGLSENSIKKDLSKNYDKDFTSNQKFILPETMKLYHKKHNLTISIVNNKLVIGLLDTVDPETHLPLFNCTCVSKICNGYEITNNSLKLVNKEYPCLNNNNKISLINIEYYLKRIQLHIKEIETKIENFNKNLKYDIKNSKLKKINNTENKEGNKESGKNQNEEENDDFEIRRNTFEIKKKNNNEISLVQILGKSLKNDYSTLKKQRYETIDKLNNNDSSININNEEKRFENIKILKDEGNEESKAKNLSFIHKIKRSIKEKEHLLRLAQGRSQKYLETKKAEIRSINMARNKKFQKDKYIDISEIFNNNKNSKGKKNPYEKLLNKQDKKKDFILDNLLNDINKKGKYERILSSFISNNKNKNEKEEEKNEKKDEENINKRDKEKLIKINESKRDLSDKRNKRYLTIEETEKISSRNKGINTSENNKGIKYPLIKSNLKIILNKNKKGVEQNPFFESRNIVTLNGLNSLGEQSLSNSKSSKKIFKRYNKIMNNNYKKSKILLKLNKINNNLIENEADLKEKSKSINNRLPKIISIYDTDKVHFFDPLIFDKINVNYLLK